MEAMTDMETKIDERPEIDSVHSTLKKITTPIERKDKHGCNRGLLYDLSDEEE